MATVRSISVQLRAEVANYIQGLTRARAATSDLVNELSKAEEQRAVFERLGTGITIAGAGIAAGVGLATRAAIEWESAWAGVEKTVDGTETQLAALEEELRAMARELPATHAEIAAVAEAAGQLGVRTEDIAQFTRTMIALGETTNLTADQAATSLAQLMNIMGTAPENVERLASALVDLGNNSATTERDILEMAMRIAGAGAVVGATESDVLALATALASAGIQAEAGGSSISRVLIEISTAVAQGSDKVGQFAAVAGMSARDFADAFRRDPVQATNAFIVGLGRMNEAGQDVFTTLERLGFSEILVRDALLRLASAGDLLTQSLETGARAWEQNRALAEEAEKRYATTAAQLEIARNQLNDFAIEMGATFLPIVAEVAGAVGAVAEAFGALPDPVQSALGFTAALTGGVLLLGGAILNVVPRIAAYKQAVEQLQASQGMAATAVDRLNRSMRATITWGTRAAGAVAALQLAGAALNAVLGSSLNPQIDALALGLRGIAAGARPTGEAARLLGGDLEKIRDQIVFLARDDARSQIVRYGQSFLEWLVPGLDATETSLTKTRERVAALDAALAQMAREGSVNEARLAVLQLANEFDLSFEQMMALLPELAGVFEVNAGRISEGSVILATDLEHVAGQFDLVGEGAEGAAADMLLAWAQANDEFVSLVQAQADALDQLATEQEEAAERQKVSLEELADDYELTADRIIKELEKQLDAQRNWQENMITLAGRVPPAVLDELARLGPEGAPLVQALVDASDEEMLRFIELMGQRGAQGGEGFAVTLAASGPKLAAIAEELGADTAMQIAAAMAANGTTLEEEAERLGIRVVEKFGPTLDGIPDIHIEVDENSLNTAEQELSNVARGRTSTVTVNVQPGAIPRFGVSVLNREGGVYTHAQDGLLREAQVFAPVAPARYAFAEPATGGEAFIPRFGDRERSLAIADAAAQWHGGRVVDMLGGPFQWRGQRPSVTGGDGAASSTVNTTYNVFPQRADFTVRDLETLQRVQDTRARVGRPG